MILVTTVEDDVGYVTPPHREFPVLVREIRLNLGINR